MSHTKSTARGAYNACVSVHRNRLRQTAIGKHRVNDELKKLGLRIRPRVVEPARKPGQVAFDDRGNAVFEWSDARLSQEGEDGDRAREQALEYHGLTLVDEDPVANTPIRNNQKGLRIGYNPYESGLLEKKERKKKRDLRELSKWIETKRKVQTGEE